MSLIHHQCVSIGCDDCEDPWEGHDGGTPHFDTEAEAVAFAGRLGWVIVGGSTRCDRCAAKADCAATGHQYGEWRFGHVAPDVLPHRTRWCEHCNDTEYDPPFGELLLFKRAEKQLGT